MDRTAERLAVYAQVKNTYLSTFQTLASLGLMLGTIGLAVVLLRNLVERRAELALLAAIGFRPRVAVRLVLGRTLCCCCWGYSGHVCALIANRPSLVGGGRSMNVGGLAADVASVLVVGLGVVGGGACGWDSRRVSAADLRAE